MVSQEVLEILYGGPIGEPSKLNGKVAVQILVEQGIRTTLGVFSLGGFGLAVARISRWLVGMMAFGLLWLKPRCCMRRELLGRRCCM
mmetsp:Transcript_9990/g.15934  ORF Transcript_9990/g.15934 Transcript_9990/m.15934 type:complete len:87 (+) Transcript_9990:1-261(+)